MCVGVRVCVCVFVPQVQWVVWRAIDLQEEGLRGSEAPWSPGLHRNCSGLMETAQYEQRELSK